MGGTVEAKSSRTGVVADHLAGRRWDTGVLVPFIDYSRQSDAPAPSAPRSVIYRLASPLMKGETVKEIQRALRDAGFDPGTIDGEYGPITCAAVRAYQAVRHLLADGEVGPKTARSLGVKLVNAR
jgi:peptidoglycan hydrolase-like protein with peptidoglycan-binding domain